MRGGLAMAAIVACGGFSAVCGSSLATAATMSKVAMPSMRKAGYADSLATGSIAAGGTLGILIPPSVILIIYGLLTEADIGKLFIAGIIPGLLGVLFYLAAVYVTVLFKPALAPRKNADDIELERKDVWGVLAVLGLFAVIMIGIYGGFFTPTEAAGIGAATACCHCAGFRRPDLGEALHRRSQLRPHHRDDLRDHHRRGSLFQLHQLCRCPGRPSDLSSSRSTSTPMWSSWCWC